MEAEALLALLENWEGDHGYHVASLSVTSKSEPAAAAVDREISDWAGNGHGWVARTSGVQVFPGEENDTSLGPVVAAELTRGDTTLQVRRHPEKWVLTILTETGEKTHLADEIVHLTTGGGAARYMRYWQLPADGAVEIIASRFIGFEEVQ